jgi:hypothetical protein
MLIKRILPILILFSLLISACLVTGTPVPLPPKAVTTLPQATLGAAERATPVEPGEAAAPTAALSPSGGLSEWVVPTPILSKEPVTAWQPSGSYPVQSDELPVHSSDISNAVVLDGLTPEQKAFLEKNGIVVIHSQETQFSQIRNSVSTYNGQPYYLTTDAAYHALHLTFDELLKAIERQSLRPGMKNMIKTVYDAVRIYQQQMQGTPLENDTRQATAYLAVALKLFDPEWTVDADLDSTVAQQVDQINAGRGKEKSTLFPTFEDDYGAYKPVGHYAGDARLESYFRGMTWLGRMHFKLNKVDPKEQLTRVPLIITLVMRRAQMSEGGSAADEWTHIHSLLTFLIGPSDDGGPVEYASLMDQVYGPAATITDLADEARWEQFINQSDNLPSPKIESLFYETAANVQSRGKDHGWRLMGQRFTLDGFIFQNLVNDKVKKRNWPQGLDVAAVLGSQPALDTLEQMGETKYVNYPEQMDKLKKAVQAQPENQWLNNFYNNWLYGFIPQVAEKNATYPPFMQTRAWAFKDVNTTLGSWVELKHDTILYSKMPEGYGGGGPPGSPPAPGMVEANPAVFYRLAYAVRSLYNGLEDRFNYGHLDPVLETDFLYPEGALTMLPFLPNMADTFEKLGHTAEKELAGTPLQSEDYDDIQSCLGPVECMILDTQSPHRPPESQQKLPEVPVVAAVAGYNDSVMEAGVGNIDRIYVVVPLEGKLQVAQGGVFSYYEFIQPRDNRLTDEAWRKSLVDKPPAAPQWVSKFVLPGGKPASRLVFRVGDVYLVTPAGANLNMRANPSKNAALLLKINTGDYLTIQDGPVTADGYTWWKVQPFMNDKQVGWVVEDQTWYERAYGQ